MFPQEAAWIEAALARLPAESLTPLLDIGSSDLEFRSQQQPWIDAHIYAPLRAKGVAIHFCDLKDSPGVDIVANLLTDEGQAALRAIGLRSVLCCNVLEHVPDAPLFAERLGQLVGPGGYIVLTVPHRYPYHRDPIDTMFRPDIGEAAALFPDFEVVESAILDTGSYRSEFARRPVTMTLRHLFRFLAPFLGWEKWKRSVSKLQYLARPYQVTCLVLRKRDA
jgi:hypothetical protein